MLGQGESVATVELIGPRTISTWVIGTERVHLDRQVFGESEDADDRAGEHLGEVLPVTVQ